MTLPGDRDVFAHLLAAGLPHFAAHTSRENKPHEVDQPPPPPRTDIRGLAVGLNASLNWSGPRWDAFVRYVSFQGITLDVLHGFRGELAPVHRGLQNLLFPRAAAVLDLAGLPPAHEEPSSAGCRLAAMRLNSDMPAGSTSNHFSLMG